MQGLLENVACSRRILPARSLRGGRGEIAAAKIRLAAAAAADGGPTVHTAEAKKGLNFLADPGAVSSARTRLIQETCLHQHNAVGISKGRRSKN